MHRSVKILFISTLCLLIGRAWQHLFWDAPFRSLLWDQSLLEHIIVPSFYKDWNTYVTSLEVDAWINRIILLFGLIYLVAVLFLLTYKKTKRFTKLFLIISGIALIILNLLFWKERFYQIGQLIEYASQVSSPFLLGYVLYNPDKRRALIWPIKICVMLTFLGHGLYAIGFHPQPGHFIDMFINVFGVSEETSKTLLLCAGVLDFIAVFLLLIPRMRKWALAYIILWAVLTSFARIVAHFNLDFIFASLHQWVFEVMVRIPHFGLPLYLLYIDSKHK